MVSHKPSRAKPKADAGLIIKRMKKVTGRLNRPGIKKHTITVQVRELFFTGIRCELRKSFCEYISAKDAVVEVFVPGDLCPARLHRKSAEHVRVGFSSLVDWVVKLNDLKFSLDGKFDLSDFGLTHSGLLKGKAKLMDKLVLRTEGTTKNDMFCLGTIAEAIYSSAPPPPADILDIIDVLKNFEPKLKPLLLIHSSRENGTMKGVLFTKMFDRLAALKDTEAYSNVLDKLPLENWPHRAMTNVHLHHLLRFKFGVATITLHEKIQAFLSSPVRCDPTPEGLLTFRRNGEAHLLKDYSYDPHGGVEEGLIAAATAAAVFEPSFAAVIAAQQQPPAGAQLIPTGNEPEFLGFLIDDLARLVSSSIQDGISGFKDSRELAKAAAAKAAVERKNHAQISSLFAQRHARIEGNKEGYSKKRDLLINAPALLSQPVEVRQMFNEEDISDMMEVMDPNLLHRFQRAMFDEELIGTLKLHESSAVVCLQ